MFVDVYLAQHSQGPLVTRSSAHSPLAAGRELICHARACDHPKFLKLTCLFQPRAPHTHSGIAQVCNRVIKLTCALLIEVLIQIHVVTYALSSRAVASQSTRDNTCDIAWLRVCVFCCFGAQGHIYIYLFYGSRYSHRDMY